MLRDSNITEHICSLFVFGFKGASVNKTGCSDGSILSSFEKICFQIVSISSQFVIIPCSIGYFRFKIPFLFKASSPT